MGERAWSPVIAVERLTHHRPVRVRVDGADLLVVRNGEEVFAIGNRCSHQGAPLHQGRVHVAGSLRTASCPLHGSTFDLRDGRVLRGPATEPVAAFETRVTDGMVEVRPG